MGPFIVSNLYGKNAVEVILTGELSRKHPVFPVSLLKHYKDPKDTAIRKNSEQKPAVVIPILQPEGEKKFLKILKQKRVKVDNKDVTLYLVRYKHRSADQDEWLPADKIPNPKVTLRAFRASNRDQGPVKSA